MPSYAQVEAEYNALVFGIDHHISTKTSKNIIETEFELYFQDIIRYVNKTPDNKISHLKIELKNICDRYNIIRVS